MIDTTVAPTIRHPLVPQLNYQVPSFVGTLPNNHVNMMMPKSDVFIGMMELAWMRRSSIGT
jgi:hypothetical protein